MKTKRIVIDTNVMFSALQSNQGSSFRLLSMIDQGWYEAQISAPLIVEYEAVLKRGQLSLTHQEIDDVIDYMCQIATHQSIFYLWRPTLRDACDDFMLELAVKSQAHIVTWNVKDFKPAHQFGIHVYTPQEFLTSYAPRSTT